MGLEVPRVISLGAARLVSSRDRAMAGHATVPRCSRERPIVSTWSIPAWTGATKETWRLQPTASLTMRFRNLNTSPLSEKECDPPISKDGEASGMDIVDPNSLDPDTTRLLKARRARWAAQYSAEEQMRRIVESASQH